MKSKIKEYLSKIGQRGGSAGRGAAKRRGSSAYYRKLARLRRKEEKEQAVLAARAKRLSIWNALGWPYIHPTEIKSPGAGPAPGLNQPAPHLQMGRDWGEAGI